MMVQVGNFRFAASQVFHDRAHGVFGNFDEQFFDRLEQVSVFVLAVNHLRPRYQHLVPFAAHLLDQNGDLHFAAPAHVENIRRVGVFHAQGHVCADFLDQPLANVPRRDELPFLPRQRPIIDRKLHLDRGRINRHKRQRLPVHRIGNGLTDEHILKASHANDVPRVRFRNFNSLQAFKMEKSGDL